MTNQADRDARSRMPRARDSLGTLMLGTLSMGLGGLTICLALAGIFGQHVPGWHQQESVWADAVPRQYEEVESIFGGTVRAPLQDIVARIWIPSGSCTFLSLIGLAFGGIGIAQGIPERRYSVLSVVGAALSLLSTLLGVAYWCALTLLYKVY